MLLGVDERCVEDLGTESVEVWPFVNGAAQDGQTTSWMVTSVSGVTALGCEASAFACARWLISRCSYSARASLLHRVQLHHCRTA
jgi:hypothetical protein